ncbi:YecH family metal-binding protein [Klebsiella pneumoniae]
MRRRFGEEARFHTCSAENLSAAELVAFLEKMEAAIRRRFGEEARFHTCSAENLSAAELVAFLEKKGKFIAREEGFTTAENKICRH